MSRVPSFRTSIISFLLLFIAACGGGGGGGGNVSVRLELPQGVDPSMFFPDDRIVVRIYGPDFPEKRFEFERSLGRGTIEGIPAGEDRVIKVDEYDSAGNLLARGFAYGLRWDEGEERSVPVTMVPKGWVITVAGGRGPGDSPDGTYAGDALLNGPAEVEYYQGKIFINDLSNRNIKIIDEYFKINKVGNITDISILSEG
ncbi:MAG: hypothetical protein GTO08_08260, partial [Deltaproteobacteria bacterium]|nr:hypothetical protein [Deltaproteobacteria bacterium]